MADFAWEHIGIEKKIQLLLDAITRTEATTPSQNTRLLGKLKKWRENLEYIVRSITRIQGSLSQSLEIILDTSFSENEMLVVSMFQPSTKNIFSELKTHYLAEKKSPLTKDAFQVLIDLSEMGQAIALVGDAAISLAVLHYLWRIEDVNVGDLTQERADLVSNENMTQVCDDWSLYDHRIHFDPQTTTKSEMEHDKGTLLEAVFGVVYICQGLEKVRELIKHLV
ncbi:MAG: ribonuclease III domain-containing protein [Candidatus Thorarchaeota archaeon]